LHLTQGFFVHLMEYKTLSRADSNQAMAALEEEFCQTMPDEMGYDYLGSRIRK
jgi:hypothetical protein